MGLLRRRLRVGEDGSMVVEIVVGALILTVAIVGVIGSMGSSMGLVGHSRQRSSGTGVAQERLERAHGLPFDELGLLADEDPPIGHVATPGHPNNDVSPDGTTYRGEELVFSASGLKHLDDPFTLANTQFTVHQYVTWASEPTMKRVTVVVTWKFPVRQGTKHRVTQATLVSDGVVDGPTPPPAPSATPAPAGGGGDEGDLGKGTCLGGLGIDVPIVCPADDSNPSITEMIVLSGSGTEQGYLNSTAVELRIKADDPVDGNQPLDIFLKNAATTDDCLSPVGYPSERATTISGVESGTGERPPANIAWTIPPGDGVKSICAYVRAFDGRTSNVWGVNVKLDQTAPTVPESFQQVSCSLSAKDRTVSLTWSGGTDENFWGYRVFRSIESGPYAIIGQTTSTSHTDTADKNYSTVRYVVRTYDKAGNESADSTVISYAKNRC